MTLKATLLLASLVTVALAGCAGEAGPDSDLIVEGHVAEEDQASILQAGKGAIEGLLVDDRFRPLQLTDDPITEFQFSGFLLVQELGIQLQTNANGEFTVLDLEPGTYTLRPQVEGHEGIPQKLRVDEGVFAEVNVLLRRVSSANSAILTEEYTGFTPCAVPLLVFNCLDASAESYRPGPSGLNYTGFGDDLKFVVVEGLISQQGYYTIQCVGPDGVLANIEIEDAHYGKTIFLNDEEIIYDSPHNVRPFTNPSSWRCTLFTGGAFSATGVPPTDPSTQRIQLGIKAQYIISIFLGEPAVDLEAYQILTASSS